MLDRYADRHGIAPREVSEAITGYATDMVTDLFYETVSQLEHEIEADSE